MPGQIHRTGGGAIANLRLKPPEATLTPPGISVLQAPTPGEAAAQTRAAFPKAARVVGTTSEALIRSTGFDVVANPTRKFPGHHRIIHPDGVTWFTDANLARLAEVFSNTAGH